MRGGESAEQQVAFLGAAMAALLEQPLAAGCYRLVHTKLRIATSRGGNPARHSDKNGTRPRAGQERAPDDRVAPR
jgi:hypothetical protein